MIISSCQKDITVSLPKPDKAVVIEGSIENGDFATVKITRNLPYFELLDSAALIKALIVLNASITVSDGVNSDVLRFTVDSNLVPPFIYKGSTLKGEVGKTYSLRVLLEGNEYTAQTTIPPPVLLDSLRFKLRNPQDNDSLGLLWIYFKDPDTLGNNYRIFTKTIGKDKIFVHPNASVANDKLINGQKVEYVVSRGRNTNIQTDSNADPNVNEAPRWAFVKGETVVLKFCSIDIVHFDFWKSIQQQLASNGNPFSSPTSVRSNIKGGAIGIWGAYGVTLDTIHIPKLSK